MTLSPVMAWKANLVLFVAALLGFVHCFQKRSFTVDYEGGTFLKDGQPFRYVSGSIHYARVPSFYWKDRLMKMRAAGLTAVQVYVPWNFHEADEGVYNFEGDHDLVGFLQMAQNIGLYVILRPGPYICAEWEFGGFPAWILKENASIVVRSMDPGYLKPVDKWLGVLMPKLKPMLYVNGGPILMVQVENEYGSYRSIACDHEYTAHLRDQFHYHLGDDAVLFTTDGDNANFLRCGAINDTLAAVDFGPTNDVATALGVMRTWNKGGPLVNAEFYTGWLHHWFNGYPHGDTKSIVNALKKMLDLNASVNMYMFEGGTNFGFWNGVNEPFQISETTYDYNAPLTESGDITPKFLAIRQLLTNYTDVPDKVPPSLPKYAYGKIPMSFVATVRDALPFITYDTPTTAQYPLNMERINQHYGFIMYRHTIQESVVPTTLSVPGIRDRGYVLLDGVKQGLLDRTKATSFNMLALKGQQLDIIVENQGRINFGGGILKQTKGIISNVTLGGKILTNWTMFPLKFDSLSESIDTTLRFRSNEILASPPQQQPSIYYGYFVAPNQPNFPQDTFFNPCGWFKGQVYINGFNLGRYWPTAGSQVTLYVPASVIKPYPQTNTLIMVELDYAPCWGGGACSVSLTDKSILSGKCFAPDTIQVVSDRKDGLFGHNPFQN